MRSILIVGFLAITGASAAQPEEDRPWSRTIEERNRERLAVLEERVESMRERVDRIESWGIYILLGTGAIGGGAGFGVGLIGRRNGKPKRSLDDTRS